MDLDAFVHDLLDKPTPDLDAIAALPESCVQAIVERLHTEVERHFYINAHRSLQLATVIEQIGHHRHAPRIIGLGRMKRGDALRFLGQLPVAWEVFDDAGHILLAAGDEVGWARTRIGRLLVCVDLQQVDAALAEAEQARAIFTRHQLHDRLLVLDLHLGMVYNDLGDQERALERYHAALATADRLGDAARPWLAQLHTNIGNIYHLQGDFRSALQYQLRARDLFAARQETSGVALAEMNAAHSHMAQGHYRRALRLLHDVTTLYVRDQLPLNAAFAGQEMVECCLLLNRYAEARDLAAQVSAAFQQLGSGNEQGLALLSLAMAEAELGNDAAAQAALDQAARILGDLGAEKWMGTVHLFRGRLAVRQGDLARAEQEARAAERRFALTQQQLDWAAATLLGGQIALARGDLVQAGHAGRAAQAVARRCTAPPLRYATHLFLGRVAAAQGDTRRAIRRYRAAVATVEQVQQRLTITLRPDFLGDKQEALHALIALHLAANDGARAFDLLERAKSQVLLNYLVNREQLQWPTDDPRTRILLAELDHLRAQHHALYRRAYQDGSHNAPAPDRLTVERARTDLTQCERRLRTLTEQLYLHPQAATPRGLTPTVSLPTLQAQIDDATLLVEYYSDATGVWAFTVDARRLEVQRLPVTVTLLDRLVAQLQLNINAALHAGPRSPVAGSLAQLAQRILARLHAALIAPLESRLSGYRRLLIVPYGILHYVPMHLLHNGAAYLIEQREVVILPAAGLLTRPAPVRPLGARVLAHSWEGRLTHTCDEATVVCELFGGTLCHDDNARRTALKAPPTQILHIAAHAAYRLDQPDLSYIELADGQLFADDLMQEDLSYELVTLSACETGRAAVAPGDELIGLGRGFLYAGAGALIASLWRVPDDVTVTLMAQLYQALHAGAPKAVALRQAQCALKGADAGLHPAFWGAFQLIGDARPLSVERALMRGGS